ncbi:hypothetical protein TrispH2_005573 [Trichoplax sp. H2]|nr:hypothetical protein TrispH2_005573 [Trichoplax sp. H2]|eukprot:RDD42542.1 hypothetical protein TrispH2_005573 [Trichoplax sp. H2]
MASKSMTAVLQIEDQDYTRHYAYQLDGKISSVVQSLQTLRHDFGSDINKVIADQASGVMANDPDDQQQDEDDDDDDDDDSSDQEPNSKKVKTG